MEGALKCNIRGCRRDVKHQGLVTTCSHIFCADCAARHGLSAVGAERRRKCPACQTELPNPDDAVLTNLDLSEEYKASVLSGLSPTVIMECTGRALSFWAYQTSQEDVFQRQTVKKISAQLKTMHRQCQKEVSEATAETESLRERLQTHIVDHNNLQRKYEELCQMYKDKSRRLSQVQELYDRVKRKAELGQMEAAPPNTVDSDLTGLQIPESTTNHGLYEQQAESAYLGPQHHSAAGNGVYGHTPARPDAADSVRSEQPWSRPGPAPVNLPQTPRGAPRGPLVGNFGGYGLSTAPGLPAGTPSTRGFSNGQANYMPQPQRQPTVRGRGLGVGLSSGIRTSHTGIGPAPREPQSHSRVVQRPVLVPPAYGAVPNLQR